MTLSDILSRIKVDKSKPNKIIPISFDVQDVLQDNHYIHTDLDDKKA